MFLVSKKYLLNSNSSMLFLRLSVVLGFTFRSVIHLTLIFVGGQDMGHISFLSFIFSSLLFGMWIS